MHTSTGWFRSFVSLAFALTVALTGCARLAQAPVTVEKSPQDPREYRHLELDNGLEVMLVRAPDSEMTAVALAVGVGSFHNPDEFPGLAHYLEHMLFLGTESYPEPNALQKYLQKNAGFANAYTSSDHTNYFFQTPNDHLNASLDRFSGYFTAPLFDREYSDKERTAVHNEWSMGKNQDQRILYQLLGLTGNPEHPAARLSVGNRETLPGGDSGLYEAMLAFYERHYVAERMRLTMVGQLPLDEQEALVRRHFSAIPDREPASNDINERGLPESSWGKHIYYRPQKELRQLILEFPVRDNTDQWRVKPNTYLSNILSSEEPGTLGHYLREQNLVNSVSVGIQSDLFGPDGVARLYIDATEQGMAERDRIIAASLSYIELVREEGVQASYYSEYRQLAQQNFAEQSPPRPVQQAVETSAKLLDIPPAYINSKEAHFEAFDPGAIRAVLEQMRPEAMRVWQIGPNEPVDTPIPYYEGRYSVADIETDTLRQWQRQAEKISLELPAANTLLSGGEVEAIDHDIQTFTHLIEEPGLEVWFRHAEHHQDGKGFLHFVWNTELGVTDAEHFALGAILNGLLGEQTLSLTDRAGRAGITIEFDRSDSNMQNLTLHGPVGSHDALVSQLATHLTNLTVTDAGLERERERLIEWLEGEDKDAPFRQLRRWLDRRAQPFDWDTEQILAAARDVSLEDLRDYVAQWQRRATLRLFAFGHYRPEQVRSLARTMAASLGDERDPEPVRATQWQTPKAGESWSIQREVQHNDVAWIRAFVSPRSDMADFASLLLISNLSQNPFYTQLRTQEQWGYVVGTDVSRLGRNPAYMLMVQSSERALPAIQTRVETFVEQFESTVAGLDREQLSPLRDSLVAQITQKPNDFHQEAHQYLGDFYRLNPDFDTRDRLAEAIRQSTPEQVRAAYQRLILEERSGVITLQAKGTGFDEEPFASEAP